MSKDSRRTKIVCTMAQINRTINLPEKKKIIAVGANVVRMNFSHGTPDDHRRAGMCNIAKIR